MKFLLRANNIAKDKCCRKSQFKNTYVVRTSVYSPSWTTNPLTRHCQFNKITTEVFCLTWTQSVYVVKVWSSWTLLLYLVGCGADTDRSGIPAMQLYPIWRRFTKYIYLFASNLPRLVNNKRVKLDNSPKVWIRHDLHDNHGILKINSNIFHKLKHLTLFFPYHDTSNIFKHIFKR